jgi:hypothetical protein
MIVRIDCSTCGAIKYIIKWLRPIGSLNKFDLSFHASPKEGVRTMSKARDTKKEGKKKPTKSLKEKREEKRLKKAGKVSPLVGPT